MLVTLDKVLGPEELAQARRLLAAVQWGSGLDTAGAQSALVKNNQQVPETAAQLPALRQLVLEALARSAPFMTAALPLKILPPLFNRYAGQSNAFGYHVDGAMRRMPGGVAGGTPEYVRADVSATLFLSEPDEYDGGVLTIDDTFGRHGVKLPAGSMVVYPSSSLHEVTPVTRGARVSCFLFLQSMVRDAGQRRLLYDMDMALLQLRAAQGESEPVIALTGTYHNLLRRWAEN